MYKNKSLIKILLIANISSFLMGLVCAGFVPIKMIKGTIRVHYRGVCTWARACPPGCSRAHRPRGPLSPTATSADSASGCPARRGGSGLRPGSSSPAGQPCAGEAVVFQYKRQKNRLRARAKILSLLITVPMSQSAAPAYKSNSNLQANGQTRNEKLGYMFHNVLHGSTEKPFMIHSLTLCYFLA